MSNSLFNLALLLLFCTAIGVCINEVYHYFKETRK